MFEQRKTIKIKRNKKKNKFSQNYILLDQLRQEIFEKKKNVKNIHLKKGKKNEINLIYSSSMKTGFLKRHYP